MNEPEKADAIFVFGSRTLPDVWIRAAELYHLGFARFVVTTGYVGPKAKAYGGSAEGDFLASKLIDLGVPHDALIIENKSSNTYENVMFGMRAMLEKGLHNPKLILLAKPFHMRRCLATFAKQFPLVQCLSCPPLLNYLEMFQNMPDSYSSLDQFKERMIGELVRLEMYGKPDGTIATQKMPDDIKRILERCLI